MAIYDVTGNVLDAGGGSRYPVLGYTSADIQNAINAAYNAGGGVVELEADATYTVTAQIILYSDFVSLIGNGAKLDASANSGASAIKIIGGNKLETESEQIRQQYLHFMEGVYLIGSNRTPDYTDGRTGVGILCAGTSLTSISQGFLIKNCAIAGFQIGVDFQKQSWCNTLFNCDISVCDIGARCTSGFQNYGEKLTIISGCIHACSLALSMNRSVGTFQCIGAAFDYNFAIAECKSGHIYFANCHLESTKNKDYWLNVTGGVVLVRDSVFYGSQGTYGLVSMTGGKLYLKDNTKETWSMAANNITGGTFDESWI